MSKETPKDDPRHSNDQGSHKQTDKPWKGNPEKKQRNDNAKNDLRRMARNQHALISLQAIKIERDGHGIGSVPDFASR